MPKPWIIIHIQTLYTLLNTYMQNIVYCELLTNHIALFILIYM